MCTWQERQRECVLHRGRLTRPAVVSDDCYAAGLISCQQEQTRKGHTNRLLVCAGDFVMDVNNWGLKSNTRTSPLFSLVLPFPFFFCSTTCLSSSPLQSPQLNETAKQLMEIDKPTPTNVPGPSSEPAPLGPCPPGPSPSASPSNGNGSGHRRGEGKKNTKKRHSFSALSVSQRAAQLNNRHSMEISHPVLISSSDPRAAARIQVHTQTHT